MNNHNCAGARCNSGFQRSGSRLKVDRSTSANTALAPTYSAAWADVTQVRPGRSPRHLVLVAGPLLRDSAAVHDVIAGRIALMALGKSCFEFGVWP